MTFRTNEEELRTDFLDFLVKDLGYPRSSIMLEYSLPVLPGKPRYRADIIITDPDSSSTLALIELKVHKTPTTQEEAYLQVRRYLDVLDTPVPAFLVMNSVETPHGFTIFTLKEDNKWAETPRHEFPLFRALVARSKADRQTLITSERRIRFDAVKAVCYAGAVILFVLFLLSIFNVFTPSNTQLGILGGGIVFVLLPNAARLKALGFEYERLKTEK